jgi:hypothetical protein
MKPFNLQRALAGDPVVTRDGRLVTDLKFFNGTVAESICGVLDGRIRAWFEGGEYMSNKGETHYLDLFIAPLVKQGWVNLFRATDGQWRVNGPVYRTEFVAKSNALCNEITTLIEWEAP